MVLQKPHRLGGAMHTRELIAAEYGIIYLLHNFFLSPPQTSDSSADLSVLSVLGGNQLAPGTDVFYICQEYSLVFVLDMSPTMMAVVSHRS